jgi:hypothetical protein
MRTTLGIDEDVMIAARALAKQQNKTIGEVVSALARQSLIRPVAQSDRNGVPLLPVRAGAGAVTLDVVNALRDEAP